MEGKKIRYQRKVVGLAILLINDQHDDINPSTFTCDFCVESKHLQDSFKVKGCKGMLDPEHCRPILPNQIFDRWGSALCEAVVMGSKTDKYLYCPFKDCSALLVYENGTKRALCAAVCPHCKRELCPSCKVPWHTEFDCAQFQKLSDGDMVKELARKLKWPRCPSCKYYIQKSSGCNRMKCRSVM
ncbi:unnamed protein product [Prunus armeniaca]|uniref:RBR-type E3 ubiquitin transferase n=1 Tax=Prunus armeniaca TaxID=36596 RepID=A0A6J5XZ18_PRUAR|nr:unnamed protein product [Prunus armeniaca]CAB4318441.1 unnamed protein product [Prunus armeniaca]